MGVPVLMCTWVGQPASIVPCMDGVPRAGAMVMVRTDQGQRMCRSFAEDAVRGMPDE